MTSVDDRPEDRPSGDGRHARADDPAGGDAASTPEVTHPMVASVTPGLVFRWAVAATAGVFVVLLMSSALYAVRNVLVLVVIALFIAVSLDPAVRWLIRHGVRRSIAVSLIIGLTLLVLLAFIVSVVPP